MNLLLSFGPLRAYIDEVRFITNRSTGTFGYKLLKEAVLRGYKVKAVVGITKFLRPLGVEDWIEVEEYDDLRKAMETNFNWADILIMAAAVPDFIPGKRIQGKISRKISYLNLRLKATESIIKTLSKRRDRKNKIMVGFSLEKGSTIKKALEKLKENHLNLIVSVNLDREIPPFGNNPVSIALVEDKRVEKFPRLRKFKLSEYIFDKIEEISAKI